MSTRQKHRKSKAGKRTGSNTGKDHRRLPTPPAYRVRPIATALSLTAFVIGTMAAAAALYLLVGAARRLLVDWPELTPVITAVVVAGLGHYRSFLSGQIAWVDAASKDPRRWLTPSIGQNRR